MRRDQYQYDGRLPSLGVYSHSHYTHDRGIISVPEQRPRPGALDHVEQECKARAPRRYTRPVVGVKHLERLPVVLHERDLARSPEAKPTSWKSYLHHAPAKETSRLCRTSGISRCVWHLALMACNAQTRGELA